MIQRIQSVYMLLSVVACVVCLASPVGMFTAETGPVADLYNLWLSVTNGSTGDVVHKLTPWVAGFALLAFAATFTLLNIFIYNRRTLQMRTLLWCVLVLAGYYIVEAVFVWRLCDEHDFRFRTTVFAALPFVSLVLDLLALRAVRKDDNLVKSLDRLR